MEIQPGCSAFSLVGGGGLDVLSMSAGGSSEGLGMDESVESEVTSGEDSPSSSLSSPVVVVEALERNRGHRREAAAWRRTAEDAGGARRKAAVARSIWNSYSINIRDGVHVRCWVERW